MSRGNPADPCSASMVDKLIGGAYKYVRLVADNIKAVQYVAANMAHIYASSLRREYSYTLPTDVFPSTVTIPVTDTVDVSKVRGSTVAIALSNGASSITVPAFIIYNASSILVVLSAVEAQSGLPEECLGGTLTVTLLLAGE